MNNVISYNQFVRNIVITSMIIIISLFLLYGKYIQSSSIEKSIQNDAKVISNLIFQNIYTVMKNGDDKTSIDKTIQDLQNSLDDIKIKIVKDNVFDNSVMSEVYKTKMISIAKNGNHIDILSPIIYKNDCMSCHANAKVGEIAAVILIEYPILSLKISLKEILIMASILFLIIIVVFFSLWLYFIKKYFVFPIKSLITQIKSIISHEDLEKEIFIDTSIKELKELENSFNNQNKQIIDSYKELEIISNTDHLTGIFNRKKFTEYSLIFVNNAKRYDAKFSLLVIDLNKFKFINDNYGHDIGDEILILFTKVVSELIRESDYFFRTGGDEFIVLLSNTIAKDANKVIEKINDSLEKNQFKKDDLTLTINASFGVAQFKVDGEDVDTLIKVADDRMYENKRDTSS